MGFWQAGLVGVGWCCDIFSGSLWRSKGSITLRMAKNTILASLLWRRACLKTRKCRKLQPGLECLAVFFILFFVYPQLLGA